MILHRPHKWSLHRSSFIDLGCYKKKTPRRWQSFSSSVQRSESKEFQHNRCNVALIDIEPTLDLNRHHGSTQPTQPAQPSPMWGPAHSRFAALDRLDEDNSKLEETVVHLKSQILALVGPSHLNSSGAAYSKGEPSKNILPKRSTNPKA